MSEQIKAIKGMKDLLPDAIDVWHGVEQVIRELTEAYGYAEIRLPIVERTELFKRSIGEYTDIVEKEMYTFTDNDGDQLTLRPEATASCMRAGIEHGLFYKKPARLWYLGPMFRHERPQKERYRQFYQFGIEAIGWPGPDIDAEVLLFGERLWRKLGVTDVTLEINSLGSAASRHQFKNDLVSYLQLHETDLDADSQRRVNGNPLRILDSKNEQTQEILDGAPNLLDYLDSEARQHFDGLCGYLDENKVNYRVNPRLVRGLDYYSSTVFEWVTDKLGAQNAVCAGGRYDGLIEQLGGQSTPSAGFAMGMERVIALAAQNDALSWQRSPDVYLVLMGDAARQAGLGWAEKLRDRNIKTIVHCGEGSMKSQMKRADKCGAQFALILGDDEIAQGTATIKSLRNDTEQQQLAMEQVVDYLKPRADT